MKIRRAALAAFAIALLMMASSAVALSSGPRALLAEDDGSLLVVLEGRGSVARIDPDSGVVTAESQLGSQPFAIAQHPDGRRLYVSCRRSQEIVEVDRETLEVLRRILIVGQPVGIDLSSSGELLFVALHSLDQVAVIDVESGEVVKHLLAGNGPMYVRRAPVGGRVYVSSLLSRSTEPGRPPRNELTVIDERTARVVERTDLVNANIGREIAFHPDSDFGVLAISRPKNLVPAVQVARGWIVTNGFALVWLDGSKPPVQLLIDLPNEAYADVYGAVWAATGKKFYVTASGVDQVIAVDLAALGEVLDEVGRNAITRPSDHLGLSRRYVTARTRVGANPVGMAISKDGKWLYVANRLADTVSVLDTSTDEVVRTLELDTTDLTEGIARGERIFHSASKVFQTQFSCASCHPEGGVDGLQYDLEPDGIGQNILDNRNLRDVDGTAPFKWVGTNPDVATQCGTRTAKWIVRTGWLTSAEVVDLADYIHTIEPSPNPYLSANGRLTKAQRRGKRLFERTHTNSGEMIPEQNQCHFCHSGPKFTNRIRFDVGTMSVTDTKSEFDTAHLNNIFESAPYLHDGRAGTLEEIWTIHNPNDTHGFSSDWTKQQLNDLVEYLKVLSSPEELP